MKKQKHQSSVKNVIFMSAKTVSSDIILVFLVYQNGKKLFCIFPIKLVFSICCFQSFSVNILPVLKSVAFTWCEEWVAVAQTILCNSPKIFRNSNLQKPFH